jgi:DNA-directed RNA polymerase beta subunit/DNA-directed RNA polymerase beta' subunit
MYKGPIMNIHGNSYERFWRNKFQILLEKAIKKILDDCKDEISFSPSVSDLKLRFHEDFSIDAPEAFCQQQRLDYTQSISFRARLDQSSDLATLHLGRIPKQTREGDFIINGKERSILAQLIKSPGLSFYEEIGLSKYRYAGVTYACPKIRYSARVIPQDGVWLEFDIFKTLHEDSSLIPIDIWNKIKAEDGRIRVKIRRAGWFPLSDLYLALDIKNASDIPLSEPDNAIEEGGEFIPGSENDEEWESVVEEGGWRKIAECLKIKSEKGKEHELKKRIREKILDGNYLSELGRYQINRRLGRISGDFSETHLYLLIEDIQGICRYLFALYDGRELSVDDDYSLAVKKVRLVGDLLEEVIIPRGLRGIQRSVKKRVDTAFKASKTKLSAGDFVRLFGQACLSGDKFLRTMKRHLFAASGLSRIVPHDNLLQRKAIQRRLTLFGPGGLSTEHVKKVRDLHWSHYGRLCPVDTPQSERLGLTLSIPLEARVNHLGLIEVPLHPVEGSREGELRIEEDSLVYLSAAHEEDERPWIAYFDQKDFLLSGQPVWARRGEKEFQLVDCEEIRYIDAFPHQQFSLAARLVPFLQHNDANRVLMACSAMRQALALNESEAPLIQTGYEALLTDGHGPWCFGRNFLVAYMPYKGLNFEDAVVVSESASRKLTHSKKFDYAVEIKEYTGISNHNGKNPKRKTFRQEVTRNIYCSDARKNKLDEHGVVKKGEWVEPGDILVGIVNPHLRDSISFSRMIAQELTKKSMRSWDVSFRVPKGGSGRVVDVETRSVDSNDKLPIGVHRAFMIRVEGAPRPLQVGDKICNRHGGKGVVSAILPDEEMPYFCDQTSHHSHGGLPLHTHVQVILNPLGIVSRLNVGQLYETHLGWFANKDGGRPLEPILPFSESMELLKKACQNDHAPLDQNGQVHLIDPVTGESTALPVTVGFSYFLKLNHLAEEKVHGRGFVRHKYNAASQQPLKGKRREGGQRMGEMEMWALEAYDARHILQEMLTLKSDNPTGRELLYQAQKSGGQQREPTPGQPEFLKVLALFLLCCGLKLEFVDSEGVSIDFLTSGGPLLPEIVSRVSIRPARRSDIESLSVGEVTNPNIGMEGNGYTKDGLFSQVLFGPLLDYTCRCGTIHPCPSGEPVRCKICGVEITRSEVRRQRIGHIELPHKVFNIVFAQAASRLLDVSAKTLTSFLVEEPKVRFGDKTDALLFLCSLLDASEDFRRYFERQRKFQCDSYCSNFRSLSELLGRERLKSINSIINEGISKCGSSIALLGNILCSLSEHRLREIRALLTNELNDLVEQKKKTGRQGQLRTRLEFVDAFLRSKIPVSHLMIEVLPVLPPGLRPPLVMEEGVTVMGDLNHLYRNLLTFLKGRKWKSGRGPNPNAIKELQRQVSAIIDNRQAMPPVRHYDGKVYVRSLAHFLKGKKGFFRANLLGKRVDYSGRAVIVPDPELNLDQCRLPYVMAVEIFMPLLIGRLRDLLASQSDRRERETLSDRSIETRIRRTLTLRPEDKEARKSAVADRALIAAILDEIGSRNAVLLNRLPTLHRLGVQAFYWKVNAHNAISMHPLVTSGFNADFDGDTAAIHRVVTAKALEESKRLLAHNNLFSPANGSLTLNLSQDIVLGAYLITLSEDQRKDFAELLGCIPPEKPLNKKELSAYVSKIIFQLPDEERMKIVETMKRICFSESTSSGLSLSIFHFPDLSAERDSLMASEKNDPSTALELMKSRVMDFFRENPAHPLAILHDSGARGDATTMTQLLAMRGPMEKIGGDGPQGSTPVIMSSLKEGMKTGEYFVSCYGSRTTLVDKKMGTADAGYVARKLVEIMHRIYITVEDCTLPGEQVGSGLEMAYIYKWLNERDFNTQQVHSILKGRFIRALLWETYDKESDSSLLLEAVEAFFDDELWGRIKRPDPTRRLLGVKIRETRSREKLLRKLLGRVLLDPVEIKGNLIHEIETEEMAGQLADLVIAENRSLKIRSPLTCKADHGVCRKCYGFDLTTMRLPEIGSKVGIIGAQSICEPGTQLVLRSFHSGGIANAGRISGDIPKVESFLNANSPAQIEAIGEGLDEDSYPSLIDEISEIYDKNGAKISDQHFEILLKGMLSRVCVIDPGSSSFYQGQLIERDHPALRTGEVKAKPVLSGINAFKRGIGSWLSAASFERAMESLAMAAIEGKTDNLSGLKENVILGKLLPPGK